MHENLICLKTILEYNLANEIRFFRISSDMVPFASHPICTYDWARRFGSELRSIGRYVRKNDIRISMHPDQFVLINAKDQDIFARSVKELEYHAKILDLMNLNLSAKIQVHVGGMYGERTKSMRRFEKRFTMLPRAVQRRLVIENDDKSYTLDNCLEISRNTGIPVLFDVLHHSINCSGERLAEAVHIASQTWKKRDGVPMADYSEQRQGTLSGRHAEEIDLRKFGSFLKATRAVDMDIMLEIKDKEKSALRAIRACKTDPRFKGRVSGCEAS